MPDDWLFTLTVFGIVFGSLLAVLIIEELKGRGIL